jgi:hypothetical protein
MGQLSILDVEAAYPLLHWQDASGTQNWFANATRALPEMINLVPSP